MPSSGDFIGARKMKEQAKKLNAELSVARRRRERLKYMVSHPPDLLGAAAYEALKHQLAEATREVAEIEGRILDLQREAVSLPW